MSEDPARAGVPSRAASQPAPPAAAPAAAAPDGASDDGAEVLEKAYVAPQVLPKAALPTTPEPDAKVVLNLPASAVGAVSEEEVRAARARRRTATVKIDRAAVAETLGPDVAAAVGPEIAVPARSTRRRSDASAAPVKAALLPDGDDATPVDRHRQLRPRPAAPAPVVTSRELEPLLDAAYTPPKSRSGLLVALGAAAVLGVGAWLLVAGAGPASTSSDSASPTARSPEAPAAAAPQSTAAAVRPTETAASTAAPPTAEVVLPSTPASTAVAASSHAATSQPTPPVSTAATKPPAATPRPPVAKPVARPPKQPKGDIPSEI